MNNEWYTPKDLFEILDDLFHFTLDPCACEESHMCDKFYTIEDDGLSQDWSDEVVFMNPPYDRSIYKWVDKACNCGSIVCCLLPARTDTKWFHDFVLPYGRIYFLKGRLRFSNSKINAPFPSMVVVFGL